MSDATATFQRLTQTPYDFMTTAVCKPPLLGENQKMFVLESDTTRQLLVLSVAGVVTAEESRETVARVREKLEEMSPGFVALVDFRWLESMAIGSVPSIAEIMDAFVAKGVSAVVRVMPDPHRDIGLNILSPFHYGPEVRLMTFETLADAIQALARD